MAALLTTLIDKQDNSELVRNKVAQILADEIAAQFILAAAEDDPSLWNFLVFSERSNPWELLNDVNGKVTGEPRLVNVWLDNSVFVDGDIVRRQQPTTTINIDCMSTKSALDNPAGGITTPADEAASLDAEIVERLVRNILMSAIYMNLQMKGIVGKRWISRTQKFQPDRDDQPAVNSMGYRVVLEVSHNEFSPQEAGVSLDLIVTEIEKGEDLGNVLASVTVDTTT